MKRFGNLETASPAAVERYAKILQSVDPSVLTPEDQKLLLQKCDSFLSKTTSRGSIKQMYLGRKNLASTPEEGADYIQAMWKNPDSKVKEVAFKHAIDRNDRKSLVKLVENFNASNEEQTRAMAKAINETLPSLPHDIEKIKPEDLSLYLKDYYDKLKDPNLDTITKRALDRRFKSLFKNYANGKFTGKAEEADLGPEASERFEKMLKVYLGTTDDPNFAKWLAARANKLGKSAIVTQGSLKNISPEIRDNILKTQWENSADETLKSLSVVMKTLPAGTQSEIIHFIGDQKIDKSAQAGLQTFTDSVFGGSNPGRLNASKQTLREAYLLADLSEKNMQNFPQLLAGYPGKRGLELERLHYSRYLEEAPVGSSKFYEAAVLAANNKDPVIRALGANAIKSDLTPTGKRAMQYMANDKYGRLRETAKTYLRDYNTKLTSMKPADLEGMPSYERVLTYDDLKQVHSNDQDFIKDLTQHEKNWAKTLPEEERAQFMKYANIEMATNPTSSVIETIAETYRNMDLSAQETNQFGTQFMTIKNPRALDIAFERLADLPYADLLSLQNKPKTPRGIMRYYEALVHNPDFHAEAYAEDQAFSKSVATQMANAFKDKSLNASDIANLRRSFMELPKSARAAFYDINLNYMSTATPAQIRQYFPNPNHASWKYQLEFMAGDDPDFVKTLINKYPGAGVATYLMMRNEVRKTNPLRPEGVCMRMDEMLRQILP